MGQPIKIYRKEETAVIHGRANLAIMIADGWSERQETVTDDLTRINGIGAKRQIELNTLDIYSYDGMATVSAEFLDNRMEASLSGKNGILSWIATAETLAGER